MLSKARMSSSSKRKSRKSGKRSVSKTLRRGRASREGSQREAKIRDSRKSLKYKIQMMMIIRILNKSHLGSMIFCRNKVLA